MSDISDTKLSEVTLRADRVNRGDLDYAYTASDRRKKIILYVIFLIFLFIVISIGSMFTVQLMINSQAGL